MSTTPALPQYDRGYQPKAPGAQTPEKYPAAPGANYRTWGEQEGWTYDPYTDQYYRPSPEKPGMLEQLTPVAATVAGTGMAYGLGQRVAQNGFGSLIPDIFSNPVAQSTQSTGTVTATPVGGSGLLNGAEAAATAPSAPAPLSGSPVDAMPPMQTAGGAEAVSSEGLLSIPESGFGSVAIPAAMMVGANLGTHYGRQAAERSGAGRAWAGANAMNPINQAQEAIGSVGDVIKGGGLDQNARIALALPTAGLSLIPFGHSRDYYDGKNRSGMLNAATNDTGSLSMQTSNGGRFAVTADQFRKDPTTYNYSGGSDEDISAANPLSYLLTGRDPGETANEQFAGLLANAHQQGVSTQDLYSQFGWDYDRAYQTVANSDLDQQDKDALLNGLDQAFDQHAYANGAKPQPTENRGLLNAPESKPTEYSNERFKQSSGLIPVNSGSGRRVVSRRG